MKTRQTNVEMSTLELPLDYSPRVSLRESADSLEEDALAAQDDDDRREMAFADALADAQDEATRTTSERMSMEQARALALADLAELTGHPVPIVAENLIPLLTLLKADREAGKQWPEMRFAGPTTRVAGYEVKDAVRVCLAGEDSRNPDCAYVKLGGKKSRGLYCGKIDPSGIYDASHEAPRWMPEFLSKIAGAPTKWAAHYGHMTGECSYCGKVLTDPPSVFFGYGPECARQRRLVHGVRAMKAALWMSKATERALL